MKIFLSYIRGNNISLIKTLIFNFKALPIKSALKLPFIVGKNVEIRNMGTIEVMCDIKTAMFTIGCKFNSGWETYKESKTIFYNKGRIKLYGCWNVYSGAKICVKENGILSFLGYNNVGCKNKIICYEKIIFEKDASLSWECEVFDTNFHNLKDMYSNKIMKKNAAVKIGEGTFIGNNASIHPGTIIPKGCVICSFSRVQGSFVKNGENLLILGNPAKVVDGGYKMLIKEFRDYEE